MTSHQKYFQNVTLNKDYRGRESELLRSQVPQTKRQIIFHFCDWNKLKREIPYSIWTNLLQIEH